MSRTISAEQMQSRKRLSKLESAISDALWVATDGSDEFTYEEIVVALSRAATRWAERSLAESWGKTTQEATT